MVFREKKGEGEDRACEREKNKKTCKSLPCDLQVPPPPLLERRCPAYLARKRQDSFSRQGFMLTLGERLLNRGCHYCHLNCRRNENFQLRFMCRNSRLESKMKKLTFDPKIRKGILPINREILLIISVMYGKIAENHS